MKHFGTKAIIAAVAAIQQVQAVDIKQLLQGVTLAQTEVDRGCGTDHLGTPFLYLGPADHKPAGFSEVIPGLNLEQTNFNSMQLA